LSKLQIDYHLDSAIGEDELSEIDFSKLEKQNELNIALENKDGETSSNQAGTARSFEPEMESLFFG
jgi:hypothetical protein